MSKPHHLRPLLGVAVLVFLIVPGVEGKNWKKGSAFKPDLIEVYKEVDGAALDLSIFFPEAGKPETPSPAIVMFHCGGFKKGSPDAFYYFCDYLATRGMVAISVEYRLGDQLDCLKDAKSAMRYVYQNAAKFGIDPTRVAAGGGSAGGHLAAATATSRIINEDTDDLSLPSVPAALVLFNPILGHRDSVNRWKPEVRRDFRPWFGIHAGMPPTLGMWGEKDKFLSVEIMKEFQQKVTAAGGRCDIEIYPGQEHSFFDNSPEWVITTVGRADAFLASLDFLEGEPTIKAWVSKQSVLAR